MPKAEKTGGFDQIVRTLREQGKMLRGVLAAGPTRNERDDRPQYGLDHTAVAHRAGRDAIREIEEVVRALERAAEREIECPCDVLPPIFQAHNAWMWEWIMVTLGGRRVMVVAADDPENPVPYTDGDDWDDKKFVGGIGNIVRALWKGWRGLYTWDAMRGRGGRRRELESAVVTTRPPGWQAAVQLTRVHVDLAREFINHVRDEGRPHVEARLQHEWITFPDPQNGITDVRFIELKPVEDALDIVEAVRGRTSDRLVRRFLAALLGVTADRVKGQVRKPVAADLRLPKTEVKLARAAAPSLIARLVELARNRDVNSEGEECYSCFLPAAQASGKDDLDRWAEWRCGDRDALLVERWLAAGRDEDAFREIMQDEYRAAEKEDVFL